ncbi:MAG: M23 family metallopeptidase [Thermoleophilia bacterium]|nr:M23 family metallopeptidase [Thermoleophilia bacterium]
MRLGGIRVTMLAAAVASGGAALGAAVARMDGDADSVRAEVAALRTRVAAAERRHRHAEARASTLHRRLRAVAHPLRASVSWPVRGPLLDRFGTRGGSHDGIDIDAPEGQAVRAAAPGVVAVAGWEDGYGNRVVVAHGRGLATVYAHLATITVERGTFVTETTTLGSVGCTGSCSGVHLHFEVLLYGNPTDPLLWLPDGPA